MAFSRPSPTTRCLPRIRKPGATSCCCRGTFQPDPAVPGEHGPQGSRDSQDPRRPALPRRPVARPRPQSDQGDDHARNGAGRPVRHRSGRSVLRGRNGRGVRGVRSGTRRNSFSTSWAWSMPTATAAGPARRRAVPVHIRVPHGPGAARGSRLRQALLGGDRHPRRRQGDLRRCLRQGAEQLREHGHDVACRRYDSSHRSMVPRWGRRQRVMESLVQHQW